MKVGNYMKNINNQKGFSLVELLAVITILGILSGLAIAGYSRYKVRAGYQGYDTLAKSSMSAAESYLLDHPGTTDVNFTTLVDNGYLENNKDSFDKSAKCKGTVRIISEEAEEDALEMNHFEVDMCCSQGNYHYNNSGKRQTTDTCQADE